MIFLIPIAKVSLMAFPYKYFRSACVLYKESLEYPIEW